MCREGVVPAQSLGADVLIVQVGEDVGDGGALLLGPLDHDGSRLICFSLGETGKKNQDEYGFNSKPAGSI